MTHTKKFIEDAIAGGYEGADTAIICNSALLDLEAWQACGKTRGWNNAGTCYHLGQGAYRHLYAHCGNLQSMPRSTYEWHNLIDHLAGGDDIETALGKLA